VHRRVPGGVPGRGCRSHSGRGRGEGVGVDPRREPHGGAAVALLRGVGVLPAVVPHLLLRRGGMAPCTIPAAMPHPEENASRTPP